MEDGPGLTPVLPVQQKHKRSNLSRTEMLRLPPDPRQREQDSPDLLAVVGHLGLVDDSCFLQQVALQRHGDTGESSAPL